MPHHTSTLTKLSVGNILKLRVTSAETRTLIHEIAMLPCPNVTAAIAKHGGHSHNNCGVCIVCACKEAHKDFYRGVRNSNG